MYAIMFTEHSKLGLVLQVSRVNDQEATLGYIPDSGGRSRLETEFSKLLNMINNSHIVSLIIIKTYTFFSQNSYHTQWISGII